MQILNWHLYLQIDVCIQSTYFLNLQNYREQCTEQSTLSEARELPVNGKAKWKHISKKSLKTEAIQAWVSQAHVTEMNVNLSRPSCLYSDPSVYVKTEYDATGKVNLQIQSLIWWYSLRLFSYLLLKKFVFEYFYHC